MNRISITLLLLLITSCIPTKIAPKFKDEGFKISNAKKFDKSLYKEMAYIFIDPKDADEFYNYIDFKYQLNGIDVGANVPIKLQNQKLFLSYQEIDKEDELFNLPLALIDAKRESNGNTKLFEDSYEYRKGYWYIVLTVYDKNLNNCLNNDHKLRLDVIKYLKLLQEEYLTTHNYQELLLAKKNPDD